MSLPLPTVIVLMIVFGIIFHYIYLLFGEYLL
jgi:hypothetical protein